MAVDLRRYGFRVFLVLLASLGYIPIVHSILLNPSRQIYDQISPGSFFLKFLLMTLVVVVFYGIGWLLDKKWYKSGSIALGIGLAFLPFFSLGGHLPGEFSNPFLTSPLFFLLEIFMWVPGSWGGHPPGIIVIHPVGCILAGSLVAAAIWVVEWRSRKDSS